MLALKFIGDTSALNEGLELLKEELNRCNNIDSIYDKIEKEPDVLVLFEEDQK